MTASQQRFDDLPRIGYELESVRFQFCGAEEPTRYPNFCTADVNQWHIRFGMQTSSLQQPVVIMAVVIQPIVTDHVRRRDGQISTPGGFLNSNALPSLRMPNSFGEKCRSNWSLSPERIASPASIPAKVAISRSVRLTE